MTIASISILRLGRQLQRRRAGKKDGVGDSVKKARSGVCSLRSRSDLSKKHGGFNDIILLQVAASIIRFCVPSELTCCWRTQRRLPVAFTVSVAWI